MSTERKFHWLYWKSTTFFRGFISNAFRSIAMIAIVMELGNFNKDTFGLTNYGFAIALGISSICFAWCRNLDSSEKSLAKELTNHAITSLYASLIFLLASAFKYCAMSPENAYLSVLLEMPIILYTFKILAILCFITAMTDFTIVITDILRLIANYKMIECDKEILEKEKLEQELKNHESDEN